MLVTPDCGEGERLPLVGEKPSEGRRFERFAPVAIMQIPTIGMGRGQICELGVQNKGSNIRSAWENGACYLPGGACSFPQVRH